MAITSAREPPSTQAAEASWNARASRRWPYPTPTRRSSTNSPGPRTPTRLRALRTTQLWWTVTGCAHSTRLWASKARALTPTSMPPARACPLTLPSTGAADDHPATCPTPPRLTGTPSSCPNTSARCTQPDLNRPSVSRRAHRQAPQPGAGPLGTVPPTPG